MIVVLARAFYADKDTRTPVVAAILSVVVNVAVSLALVGSLGLAGLALGIAAGAWFEASLLAVLLWRRTPALQGSGIVRAGVLFGVGAVLAGAVGAAVVLRRPGSSSGRPSPTRSCSCSSRRPSPSPLPASPTSPTARSFDCPSSARRWPSPSPPCAASGSHERLERDRPDGRCRAADDAPPARPRRPTWRRTRRPGIAFVAGSPSGSYMQLTAWAEVKAVNGWRTTRVVVDVPGRADRRPGPDARPGPTPVVDRLRPARAGGHGLLAGRLAAWTAAVRELAARRRLSHVTIEPQVAGGGGARGGARGRRLAARADRPGPPDARSSTSSGPEAEVWGDLRSKWRQYVNKARRDGVAIVEVGEEGIPDFHRIYVETAQRAGFVHRAESAYRDVYRAFAARDAARLLFARAAGRRAGGGAPAPAPAGAASSSRTAG